MLCDCGLNDDAGKIQLEFDWNGPQVLNVQFVEKGYLSHLLFL